MEAFPDAKVILTVRDPKNWHKSVKETIYSGYVDFNSFPLNIVGKFMYPKSPNILCKKANNRLRHGKGNQKNNGTIF